MKYSLQILKNKNFFMRHKYPSPNVLNIKYFWTLSYSHWGLLDITKLSNSELQENGMTKNRLDAALLSIFYSSFPIYLLFKILLNLTKQASPEITIPAGIYFFKINNGNTSAMCEICSKLSIKKPVRRLRGLYISGFSVLPWDFLLRALKF